MRLLLLRPLCCQTLALRNLQYPIILIHLFDELFWANWVIFAPPLCDILQDMIQDSQLMCLLLGMTILLGSCPTKTEPHEFIHACQLLDLRPCVTSAL